MKHSWYVKKQQVKMDKCKYCGSTENLTIDHKIPRIHGGTDDLKNLQCLCMRCNGMKSGMSDKQIRSLFRWFKETKFYKKSIKNNIPHTT